ncbi:LysM peptidoglycan-binding domain-containing protein [Paenibacillus spiritus]|uniref:LysM peptidoglycan-binding domain-containing protein n=1 Tax=Paenibacillus spiritus TaxID=2496557 RepID=A0A5J5FZP7_9BACL|nr:M14 family metallopeptidase [Paenibacillus spiritus]KAA8999792.1 LysM peptidoglycan-binding domain-containing protein [Paenibacillus spiritus]
MLQHTVRRGDTVARVAAVYGLTPGHVIQGNPWAAGQEYLIPGQVLFLPSAPRARYAPAEGESPEEIAGRLGVSLEELERFNPGLSPGSGAAPHPLWVMPPPASRSMVRLRGEYGPAHLEEDLERLAGKYAAIRVETIGTSVMGKPLRAVRIGKGPRLLHVNAALHANEWLTAPALLAFIEQYAEAFAAGGSWNGRPVRHWYRNWTLCAVPMANPDGVELVQEGAGEDHPRRTELLRWNGGRRSFRHWKANVSGVDLGDQFPAYWEEERKRRGRIGPAPSDYGGAAPLCEPEAAALAALCQSAPPDIAVSLHSQGREIYWNYRGMEPGESAGLANRLAAASGYRAVELTGSDAGFKDWFILKFGRPGFTVELGLGRNPLPPEEFEDMVLETGQILAELMKN